MSDSKEEAIPNELSQAVAERTIIANNANIQMEIISNDVDDLNDEIRSEGEVSDSELEIPKDGSSLNELEFQKIANTRKEGMEDTIDGNYATSSINRFDYNNPWTEAAMGQPIYSEKTVDNINMRLNTSKEKMEGHKIIKWDDETLQAWQEYCTMYSARKIGKDRIRVRRKPYEKIPPVKRSNKQLSPTNDFRIFQSGNKFHRKFANRNNFNTSKRSPASDESSDFDNVQAQDNNEHNYTNNDYSDKETQPTLSQILSGHMSQLPDLAVLASEDKAILKRNAKYLVSCKNKRTKKKKKAINKNSIRRESKREYWSHNEYQSQKMLPQYVSGQQYMMSCSYWKKFGFCRKGDACQYSHLPEQKGIAPPKEKIPDLCKFYLQDTCQKGSNCNYYHEDFPCKYFHKGMHCYQGSNCKFSHAPLTEETAILFEKSWSVSHKLQSSGEQESIPSESSTPFFSSITPIFTSEVESSRNIESKFQDTNIPAFDLNTPKFSTTNLPAFPIFPPHVVPLISPLSPTAIMHPDFERPLLTVNHPLFPNSLPLTAAPPIGSNGSNILSCSTKHIAPLCTNVPIIRNQIPQNVKSLRPIFSTPQEENISPFLIEHIRHASMINSNIRMPNPNHFLLPPTESLSMENYSFSMQPMADVTRLSEIDTRIIPPPVQPLTPPSNPNTPPTQPLTPPMQPLTPKHEFSDSDIDSKGLPVSPFSSPSDEEGSLMIDSGPIDLFSQNSLNKFSNDDFPHSNLTENPEAAHLEVASIDLPIQHLRSNCVISTSTDPSKNYQYNAGSTVSTTISTDNVDPRLNRSHYHNPSFKTGSNHSVQVSNLHTRQLGIGSPEYLHDDPRLDPRNASLTFIEEIATSQHKTTNPHDVTASNYIINNLNSKKDVQNLPPLLRNPLKLEKPMDPKALFDSYANSQHLITSQEPLTNALPFDDCSSNISLNSSH